MRALQIAKKGIIRNPEYDDLRYALSQCLSDIGKPLQAAKLLGHEINTGQIKRSEVMFNIQYLGEGYRVINTKKLRDLARKWEKQKIGNQKRELWKDRIQETKNKRKIKIGYFSADWCNHPVGRFIRPVLKNHNKEEFIIYGIKCGKTEDSLTTELKEYCDEWIDITKVNDLEAAMKIRDLKLDIIIELGGYTSGSRMGVLCFKPARKQLSYLGYFGPTYLKCIDGWIGDEILFSSLDNIQMESHKIINIKGGYMVYEEIEKVKIEASKTKKFNFGSFNHSRKLSQGSIDLYCQVMRENKSARLVLKSISFDEPEERERVRMAFNRGGVEDNRLKILAWIKGRMNHLKCYNQIDVALDPFPYGGATTTCEALWMGVPVVTLGTEGMVGKLSSSILKSANCDYWIAENESDYIAKAKLLANEGKRSKITKMKLRERILASDLCMAERLTRQLEKNYIELTSN